MLTLAVVLASATLVGVVAVRALHAASEATLQARLHDGDAAFASYSAQRLAELESLATWLTHNPAALDQALAAGASSDAAALDLLGLGSADFIAIRTSGTAARVAPSDLAPLVTPLLDRTAPLNPRAGTVRSDLLRSPDSNSLVALAEASTGPGETLVVGFYLTHAFTDQFAARTGLNLALFTNGRTVGTNLVDPAQGRAVDVAHPTFGPTQAEREGAPVSGAFSVGSTTYSAHYMPLSDRGGRIIGAYATSLPTVGVWRGNTPIDRDTFMVLIALMSVAVLSGGILARRVVVPLRSLRLAVSQIGRGDLATPIRGSPGGWGHAPKLFGADIEPLAGEIEEMRQRLLQTHSDLIIEKSLYQGTFQSMADGVFTTNSTGLMTSANPALVETLQDEVPLGHACCGTTVLKDSEGRSLCDVACSWLWLRGQAEPVVVKGFLEPASGPVRDVEMTVTPIKDADDQTVALVHVVRDVSTQEQLQRLKERFLMSVSHELRTPLSSLSTSVEFLKDEFLSLQAEDRERLLETVQRSSRRLQTLTVNLLDLGSIQSGTFSVKPDVLDLQEPLSEAIALSEVVLSSKNQQTIIHAPPDLPPAWADNVRIVQVLVNLIGNAAKYGPANESIVITLEEGPEKIRTSVTDHGGGIAPEERARLFDYFFRGSTAGRTETGFGIGLAITRGIIEAHKGEIGITSSPGEGTTFWFTLPKA